jgi:hypothetical protein
MNRIPFGVCSFGRDVTGNAGVYVKHLAGLKKKAEQFVKQHQAAIVAVAHALLVRETMTGGEAMEIVRPHLR